MSSTATVYLVTGANRPRGLGFCLVTHILATHENAFVYAAVRDPAKASALYELKEKHPHRLAIVKCVSADKESNTAMAKEIEERHGRVDTVIANAALLGAAASVHEAPPDDMEEHFRVNVVGPVVLFGAVYELLKKSKNPRFIPISSRGGSLSGPIIEFPMGSVIYASTKATLNWVSRKIHFENDWLSALYAITVIGYQIAKIVPLPSPYHLVKSTLTCVRTFPLFIVQQELKPAPSFLFWIVDFTIVADKSGQYQDLIKERGYGLPPATEVAASLLKIIDKSTREKNGGEFMNMEANFRGFALTAHILSKHENAFVYATVRDTTKAPALDELKKKYPNRLAISKWVAADVEGNAALAKEIEQRHGRVDTVIANAGTLQYALIFNTNRVNFLITQCAYPKANVLGPVVLFQAVYELLKKSSSPRFIPISSIAGSLVAPPITLDMRNTVYASSKTTLNWVTRKIHFENEWLVTFPLSPGGVDSDMFDYTKATDATGVVADLVKEYGTFPTADQAAILLLKIIDESTREKDGGEFINIDGSRPPW
ncbi:LOW QUALITY PROTEIN: hypothetical protein CVT25_001319 [Psilocybe cyanescens]|uniref:Ketoreductase (KR) domain-containing protein n=1 Tax=Psilocybe cyanescens TaxID=93625 RepID=A0A409XEP9_PSICY|nr:LOW QUALITY PROTEIN: hypothetical protein CVT25_001319 [Psilocybe cyanescens]